MDVIRTCICSYFRPILSRQDLPSMLWGLPHDMDIISPLGRGFLLRRPVVSFVQNGRRARQGRAAQRPTAVLTGAAASFCGKSINRNRRTACSREQACRIERCGFPAVTGMGRHPQTQAFAFQALRTGNAAAPLAERPRGLAPYENPGRAGVSQCKPMGGNGRQRKTAGAQGMKTGKPGPRDQPAADVSASPMPASSLQTSS